MMGDIFVSTVLVFVKVMSPVAAFFALILFLRPSLFMHIEKKLSVEFGSKKISRRAIESLEKENMRLQELLLQYNRFAGVVLLLLSLYIMFRLF